MKIVLLGLKGVGKTTHGAELARKLGWDFFDTDQEIELKFGKSPREIYMNEGEVEFRKIEHEILLDLQHRGRCVIALGGGGFISLKNQKILKNLGLLFCLHLEKNDLLQRWQEWPAICKNREEFEDYYEIRMEKLKKLSCIWIDASRKDVVEMVLERAVHGK